MNYHLDIKSSNDIYKMMQDDLLLEIEMSVKVIYHVNNSKEYETVDVYFFENDIYFSHMYLNRLDNSRLKDKIQRVIEHSNLDGRFVIGNLVLINDNYSEYMLFLNSNENRFEIYDETSDFYRKALEKINMNIVNEIINERNS